MSALALKRPWQRPRPVSVVEGVGRSLAERQANTAAVRAAVEAVRTGESATLILRGAVELHFAANEAIQVADGAHLVVLRYDGGSLRAYPDFAKYAFHLFKLGRTSRISFFNAGVAETWVFGPEYPYKLHGVQVQYTPGSNIVTRVAGETRAFDAARHLGRTAYLNYYIGTALQGINTTVAEVLSASQVRLSHAVPAGVNAAPAKWPMVGIDIDEVAYRQALIDEGSYWARRPLVAFILANAAGPSSSRGLIEADGLDLGGSFQFGIEITSHAASMALYRSRLHGHETAITQYTSEILPADELPYLHLVDSVLHHSAYVPAGRTADYYSEVHGHEGYIHPNVNLLVASTTPQAAQFLDSKGTFKLYSESVNQTNAYNVMQGVLMRDVKEGWIPTTIGRGVARDCTFIRTRHYIGDGVLVEGGSLEDSQIVRIDGLYGSGDEAADKFAHYRGVSITYNRNDTMIKSALNLSGEQRFLFEGCSIVMNVSLANGNQDLVSSYGGPGPKVFEFRGGVIDAQRMYRIGQLTAGTTVRLTGGVRLVGEPTAGYWVQLAGGTLEAVDVDLSGTSTPLTL